MYKTRLLTSLLACCAIASADPPTVIRVLRNATRANNQSYAEVKGAITVLGTISISGPSETWSFEMLDSFASMEDIDKAFPMVSSGVPYSDEVIPSTTTLIALYRANLSHRWDEAAKNIARSRYLLLSIYRIRPGAQTAFVDLMRIRRSRFESINFDQPEMTYQIISGAPSGTFICITPVASLSTFDEGLAKTPDGPREFAAEQKLSAEVEIGHESILFRIDPGSSYVSDEFASADPEFWSARPRND